MGRVANMSYYRKLVVLRPGGVGVRSLVFREGIKYPVVSVMMGLAGR